MKMNAFLPKAQEVCGKPLAGGEYRNIILNSKDAQTVHLLHTTAEKKLPELLKNKIYSEGLHPINRGEKPNPKWMRFEIRSWLTNMLELLIAMVQTCHKSALHCPRVPF